MITTTKFQLNEASHIEYLNLVTNELKFENFERIKFNSIENVEMEKGGFAIINFEQST